MDYSKWDKLEEEEEGASGSLDDRQLGIKLPRVTKLDAPSRITIGPSSVSSEASPQVIVEPQPSIGRPLGLNYEKWEKIGEEAEQEELEANQPKQFFEDEALQRYILDQRKKEFSDVESQSIMLARNKVDLCDFTRNGAKEDTFLWSQDEKEVIIDVFVPETIQAKNLSVRLKPDGVLEIASKCGLVNFNRKLANDVWGAVFKYPRPLGISSEMQEEMEIMWELRNVPEALRPTKELSKSASLTLKKHLPSELVRTIWWERAFDGGNESSINVSALKSSTNFEESWAEAQRKFRDKHRR